MQHTSIGQLTSSAQINGPTYCSSTLQRAGIQLFSDVYVTNLEEKMKRDND